MRDKCVGIIGGLGPKTAFQFAQKLNDRYTPIVKIQPDLLLENIPLSDKLLRMMAKGKEAKEILNLLLRSVRRLNNANVDFIVIPCNTVHVFIEEVRAYSQVPVLSIIEECAKRCKQMNVQKVGLLASGTSIKQKLHAAKLQDLGIEAVIPVQRDQKNINDLIVRINRNKSTGRDTEMLRGIAHDLEGRGAEVILLACTDLQQIFSRNGMSIPILDSLSVLEEVTLSRLCEK